MTWEEKTGQFNNENCGRFAWLVQYWLSFDGVLIEGIRHVFPSKKLWFVDIISQKKRAKTAVFNSNGKKCKVTAECRQRDNVGYDKLGKYDTFSLQEHIHAHNLTIRRSSDLIHVSMYLYVCM